MANGAFLLKKSRVLFPALAIGTSCAVAFWPALDRLIYQWGLHADYSHGYLIFPLAFYMGWRKKRELGEAFIHSDWRALPLLFLAIFGIVLGELGAELFTSRVAMLMLVVGAVWLVYGPEVIRILRFPLAFLLLMFPLPGFIYRNLTFDLQLFASVASVEVLHQLGISAFREGNVIDLGFSRLQIVEACSGLRYVLPLLTVGLLFAYLGQRALWKRLVLVAATVPIAVFANVVRITGTAVIGAHWGREAAQGFFHSFSGWAVFILCTFLFCLLHLALRKLPEKGGTGHRKAPSPACRRPGRAMGWPAVAVGSLIILVTPTLVDSLSRVPSVPLTRPLSAFPMTLGGWQGERSEMATKWENMIGAQDYLIVDYRQEPERPVNLYVAYYEYQRKAGDFAHSPRLCLPGAGWFIEENGRRILEGEDASTLRLNELVIRKGGARQLVYYWYQGRGRNFTSEFAAKFYMVWDGLWRKRTDGALVRIMAFLKPGESEDQARRVMDSFAVAAFGELKQYLP